MPWAAKPKCGIPECHHNRPCPKHRTKRTLTTGQRGYDGAHKRAAKAQLDKQPYCSWCGTTEDLCADHVEPGNPDAGYDTLCRRHNSQRRNGVEPPGH